VSGKQCGAYLNGVRCGYYEGHDGDHIHPMWGPCEPLPVRAADRSDRVDQIAALRTLLARALVVVDRWDASTTESGRSALGDDIRAALAVTP